MATIYCDPDGNPITSQPYTSPQDEIARLQAENAELRSTLQAVVDEIRLADLYHMDQSVLQRVKALGIKVRE